MTPVLWHASLFFFFEHSSGISAHYGSLGMRLILFKVCFFQELAMGMTLRMTMMFVLANECCQWVPKPADRSHQHAWSSWSALSACMESLGRVVRLVHLFPSTQSLVIHHHILVCAWFIFFATENTPFSPSSFCGPTVSPSSCSCGFHALFSSIIHEETRCHTQK